MGYTLTEKEMQAIIETSKGNITNDFKKLVIDVETALTTGIKPCNNSTVNAALEKIMKYLSEYSPFYKTYFENDGKYYIMNGFAVLQMNEIPSGYKLGSWEKFKQFYDIFNKADLKTYKFKIELNHKKVKLDRMPGKAYKTFVFDFLPEFEIDYIVNAEILENVLKVLGGSATVEIDKALDGCMIASEKGRAFLLPIRR